jgi:hypothetical protein
MPFHSILSSIVWCQQLVQHLRAEDVFRIGDLEHLLGGRSGYADAVAGIKVRMEGSIT